MKLNQEATMLIACIIFTFASPSFLYSQESSLNIVDAYGKYQVGFQSFNSFDKTRSFLLPENNYDNDERTIYRPIQVCVWYPAMVKSQSPMKYMDYFYLKASETKELELTETLKREVITNFLKTDPVDTAVLHKELNSNMKAIKNAQFDTSGKFPVIIYGPSWWSTAFENALLCEFLASHGYVVISSPSVGPETREMPISRIGVETQARDMEYLLGLSDNFPNADINKIIVAGFSLGGLSNVLILARNRSVDAWIGIDPSIHEAYEFFKESPYEDYTRFNKPMLFINSNGYMNNLPFYEQLVYSDAYVVNFPKLEHTDLASQFIKLNGSNDKSENVEKRNNGYNLMSRYMLSFLNGVFKESLDYNQMTSKIFNDDSLDASFITLKTKKGLPVVEDLLLEYNGVNNGIISFLNTTKSPSGFTNYPEADIQKLIFLSSKNNNVQTANDLMKWYQSNYKDTFHDNVLRNINYDEMVTMFCVLYEDNKACHFNYYQLNHSAQVMSMSGNEEQSLKYFILNTLLHPDSYQAFFNLGIGYFRLNDFENAKINFNNCIGLNPDERFKRLAEDFLRKCDN